MCSSNFMSCWISLCLFDLSPKFITLNNGCCRGWGVYHFNYKIAPVKCTEYTKNRAARYVMNVLISLQYVNSKGYLFFFIITEGWRWTTDSTQSVQLTGRFYTKDAWTFEDCSSAFEVPFWKPFFGLTFFRNIHLLCDNISIHTGQCVWSGIHNYT